MHDEQPFNYILNSPPKNDEWAPFNYVSDTRGCADPCGCDDPRTDDDVAADTSVDAELRTLKNDLERCKNENTRCEVEHMRCEVENEIKADLIGRYNDVIKTLKNRISYRDTLLKDLRTELDEKIHKLRFANEEIEELEAAYEQVSTNRYHLADLLRESRNENQNLSDINTDLTQLLSYAEGVQEELHDRIKGHKEFADAVIQLGIRRMRYAKEVEKQLGVALDAGAVSEDKAAFHKNVAEDRLRRIYELEDEVDKAKAEIRGLKERHRNTLGRIRELESTTLDTAWVRQQLENIQLARTASVTGGLRQVALFLRDVAKRVNYDEWLMDQDDKDDLIQFNSGMLGDFE